MDRFLHSQTFTDKMDERIPPLEHCILTMAPPAIRLHGPVPEVIWLQPLIENNFQPVPSTEVAQIWFGTRLTSIEQTATH